MIRIGSALLLIALFACPCGAVFFADDTFDPANWQTPVQVDTGAGTT
jgi:hypothetical protein